MKNDLLFCRQVTRIMRLTLTQLLLSGLLISAVFAREGRTQELLTYKITIKKKQETVKLLFSEIEKSLDVKFLYSSNLLNPNQKVSISKDETLGSILTKILTPLNLEYEVADRQIIIKPILVPLGQKRRDPLGSSQPALDSLVKGVVLDEKEEPLPGVNVLIKGTQRGTVTDVDGNFSINVSDATSTLVFSYVGYLPQEVAITGSKPLKIALKADQKSLDEVVVVGYGTQRKVDVTGSVASISSTGIRERPSPDALGALQGQVPGLNITQNSGQVGDYRINIRGFNSINASNNPLFVIDGIIGADYSAINPNDIERVDVLKDASASAIYGARGSGGVIIITTKQGSFDKAPTVSYDFVLGFNSLLRKIPVLNSTQYQAMEKQAYANSGKPYPNFGELEPDLFNPDNTPKYDTDWQKEAYKPTVSQNHNLSIMGGSKFVKYNTSLGYQDMKPLALNTYHKKYTMRVNVDSKVNDWLNAGLNLSGTFTKARTSRGNGFGFGIERNAIEAIPYIPVTLPDGRWGTASMHALAEAAPSPVVFAENQYNIANKTTLFGDTYLEALLLPGLKFRTSFSSQLNLTKTNSAEVLDYVQRGLYNSISAGVSLDQNVYWQSSSYFSYKKELSRNSNVDATLGAEWSQLDNQTLGASSSGFDSGYYLWNNLGAGKVPNPPSSSAYSKRTNSYFGRVVYSLADKYLFTATGRLDGASVFGENHKFAFFPSAALAWRVSEEEFLKNSRLISNLKLRVSYGSTGNSSIGSYGSINTLSTNTAIFGGVRAGGVVQGVIPNPDLKWEQTNQLNVGLDLDLFNNRFNIVADVYDKVTNNLLLNAPVPNSSGYDTQLKNIGSVRNRGAELGITSNNLTGKLTWSTTLNFAANKSKILALGVNNGDIFPGPALIYQTNILRVGEQLGTLWGFKQDGTWGSGDAAEAATYGRTVGQPKIVDLNNDGVINASDQTTIGHSYPKFTGELINRVRYGSFDMSLDIAFSQGNKYFNMGTILQEQRQTYANAWTSVLDAWTPTNQNTSVGAVRLNSDPIQYLVLTDRYVTDGSFIRGRNLTIGYNLPQNIINRIGMRSLRVYSGLQNFFLITKVKYGYDPESSIYPQAFAFGIDMYSQPRARILNLGVSATLK